ncbi:MAG: hypothetical protein ACE3JP_08265 [Ectobacillus sp.]
MSHLLIVNSDGEIVREVDTDKEKLSIRSHAQDQAFYELKKRQKEGRSRGFTFTQMGNVHEVILKLTTAQCGLLLVLITYIDFDGVLRNPDKTPMSKKDIRAALKLEGKRSFYDFMKVTLEAGILIEDGKRYIVNSRYHFKGNSRNKELVRVLSAKVRELHKQNKITDIGMFYKIQAYVHIKRNVLVKNPNETNLDKLEYLNKEELADVLDVSVEQVSKVLNRLKLDGQHCVAQLKIGREVNFVVNPDIFSRTASVKDETLRTLFRKGGKQ